MINVWIIEFKYKHTMYADQEYADQYAGQLTIRALTTSVVAGNRRRIFNDLPTKDDFFYQQTSIC